jgi:hypothetical protein
LRKAPQPLFLPVGGLILPLIPPLLSAYWTHLILIETEPGPNAISWIMGSFSHFPPVIPWQGSIHPRQEPDPTNYARCVYDENDCYKPDNGRKEYR